MFYKDEDYPVFAKAGAIIPLANIESNINNTNNPQSLEFQIFPGKDNIYTLYEDDGISKLYKDGYFIKTELKYKYAKDNYYFLCDKEKKTIELRLCARNGASR